MRASFSTIGLVLLALVALVRGHAFAPPSNLVVLSEANFDELTSTGDWFLDFYAPWCGHCQKLAPEYEAAARAMEGTDVKFGLIDCTEHTALRNRFNVRGYPTILYYRNGETRLYRGPRTQSGFVEHAKDMKKPPVAKLESMNMLKALSDPAGPGKTVNFVYLGPIGPEAAAFQSVASTLQGVSGFLSPFGMASQQLIQLASSDAPSSKEGGRSLSHMSSSAAQLTLAAVKSLGAAPEFLPIVAAVSAHDQGKMYAGPFDVPSLRSWIEANKLPLINQLTPVNFEDVTSSGKLTAFIVVDPRHKATPAYVDSIVPVARKHSKSFTFAVIDGVQFDNYVKQFGVLRRHIPTMFVLNYQEEIYWVEEVSIEAGNGLYTQQEIAAFLSGVESGELQPRSTTSWYSPARYKKMLENFLAGFTEPQLIAMMVALMTIFGFAMFMGCKWILNDPTENMDPAKLAGPAGAGVKAPKPLTQEEQRKQREAAREAALRRAVADAAAKAAPSQSNSASSSSSSSTSAPNIVDKEGLHQRKTASSSSPNKEATAGSSPEEVD